MRRSTSPPPLLSSSSPCATPPPSLSLPGLLSSCDKAGASTHTLPPAPGDSSTGQPLRSVGGQASLLEEGNNLKNIKRENSETRLLDFEIAFAKLENYIQAMSDNNIQIKDVRVGEKVAELFDKMYQELPSRLQDQVREGLNATIFQHAQGENEPPKIKGTSTKRLIGWAIDNIVLPIGLGLLMFIISLYFNKAGEAKGIRRC